MEKTVWGPSRYWLLEIGGVEVQLVEKEMPAALLPH